MHQKKLNYVKEAESQKLEARSPPFLKGGGPDHSVGIGGFDVYWNSIPL